MLTFWLECWGSVMGSGSFQEAMKPLRLHGDMRWNGDTAAGSLWEGEGGGLAAQQIFGTGYLGINIKVLQSDP